MRFGWVIVSILCVCFVATRVFPAEMSKWQGFYAEGRLATLSGEHALSFSGNRGFETDVYAMSLPGQGGVLGFGYRYKIGEGNLYGGIQTMAHFGTLSNTEEWSFLKDSLGAEVSFSSKTVYTIGVELGYAFAPKWYGYVQGGIAGAQVSLAGSGHAFGLQVSDSADGWAFGTFAAIGVKYDLGNNWALGGMYQEFTFSGSSDLVIRGKSRGSFDASLEESQVALTLEYRF